MQGSATTEAKYNKGTHEQRIEVGDKMLVLLPGPQNHLKPEWKPFEVTQQISEVDYEVAWEEGYQKSIPRELAENVALASGD